MTGTRIAAGALTIGGCWLAALGAWYAAAGLLGAAVITVALSRGLRP